MYVNFSKGLMLLAVAALVGCQVPATRSGLPIAHNLPPAQMLAEPGPGVGGPGPGVMNVSVPPMLSAGDAIVALDSVEVSLTRHHRLLRFCLTGGQYASLLGCGWRRNV